VRTRVVAHIGRASPAPAPPHQHRVTRSIRGLLLALLLLPPCHCRCSWDRIWFATRVGRAVPGGSSGMAIIGVACIVIVAWVAHGSQLAWGSTLGNIVIIVGIMVGSHVEHLGVAASGHHGQGGTWPRHHGGQGPMPLVAGIDTAASSLSLSLSLLQWSCPPSLHTPRQREDGEHDGAKEGTWHSSSASAVAGVMCWRMPVLWRSGLQTFVAAVGKWLI